MGSGILWSDELTVWHRSGRSYEVRTVTGAHVERTVGKTFGAVGPQASALEGENAFKVWLRSGSLEVGDYVAPGRLVQDEPPDCCARVRSVCSPTLGGAAHHFEAVAR